MRRLKRPDGKIPRKIDILIIDFKRGGCYLKLAVQHVIRIIRATAHLYTGVIFTFIHRSTGQTASIHLPVQSSPFPFTVGAKSGNAPEIVDVLIKAKSCRSVYPLSAEDSMLAVHRRGLRHLAQSEFTYLLLC